MGFASERVDNRGYVNLRTRLGADRVGEEKSVQYLLVDANTSYNVLLGRPCLNEFRAIVSTPHFTLKYPIERGIVVAVRTDQKTARECYANGLKLYPRTYQSRGAQSKVAMTDLDPRTNTDDQIEPLGVLQPFRVGTKDNQTTMVARGLDATLEKELKATLWRNWDLFAWTSVDMPSIHPSIMMQKLRFIQRSKTGGVEKTEVRSREGDSC